MTKEKLLFMAQRNKDKAFKTFMANSNRKGVTEEEKCNLLNNVEYTNLVYDLVYKEVNANES